MLSSLAGNATFLCNFDHGFGGPSAIDNLDSVQLFENDFLLVAVTFSGYKSVLSTTQQLQKDIWLPLYSYFELLYFLETFETTQK